MAAPAASPELQQRIRETYARTGSISATARALGVQRSTVRRYIDREPRQASELPRGKHEAAVFEAAHGLPDPHPETYAPFRIDTPGRWLILSDIHTPYHDRATIELAVSEAKRRGVVGVLLNGDTLDSHEISTHDKDPSAPRYVEEIATGRKLLAWLRGQLPSARLVLKEGNHEERLSRYIIQRAPALFGLEGIDLPALLHFADIGAEWVADKRVIELGKLPVLHGHEFRGSGGVNPSRWLYLRTHGTGACGHFHRTSEHNERDVLQRERRTWTLGCACYLTPRYMPLNSWNHGFAIVEVAADGTFSFENKRVMGGRVV